MNNSRTIQVIETARLNMVDGGGGWGNYVSLVGKSGEFALRIALGEIVDKTEECRLKPYYFLV